MEERNEIFQKLKPTCIALSQATLAFASNRRNVDDIIRILGHVLATLKEVTKRPGTLDSKLADYVFFPLSQVLKASRDLPVQAMESCLQCLEILISKGWQKNIQPSLSGQLLIFLTLTCDTSGKTVPATLATDELRTAGFECMRSLFASLNASPSGKSSLVGTANVPSLGHAVSVVIEGIVAGESFEVQFAAAKTLAALISCIDDLEVLSSFLPGITSSLTKVLTPNTKSRRHWKVLVLCVEIIISLLRSLLRDEVVNKFQSSLSKDNPKSGDATNKLDDSWVKATASQLKVALANINRLRSHDRPEVQEGLLDLNLTILSDCNNALKDSLALATETVLFMIQQDSTQAYRERLAALAQTNSSISELLATVFRNEQLSLVRIMQSNDDQAKERSLGKLFGAFSILAGTETDMSLVSRMLGHGLKDSVTTILQDLPNHKISSKINAPRVTPVILPELSLIKTGDKSLTFSSPLAEYKSQETLLHYIQTNIKALKEGQPALQLAVNLLPVLRTSDGISRIAVFWLILQDLQNDDGSSDFMNDMLIGGIGSSNQSVSMREQLYSYSIDILDDEDTADWRLKTLALEAVALHAQRYGTDFKGELVDALYPVLHHLGSDSAFVRNHAMTCLNIMAESCGYSDVGDLVVSNVDYLVNAVALKLNAFDVSPQGPQVLLMMVRLAGPSLLPYLEDTLESIFAALEDYHGYTSLVELLFAVLRTMAEEGVKSPQLAITDSESSTTTKTRKDSQRWKPTQMHQLIEQIKELGQRASEAVEETESETPNQGRPFIEEIKDTPDPEDADERQDPPPPAPPPAPKTYALLLKITQLTQHYLSSSSPSLRTSLLSLIRTTIPALAQHENSFLPLVNTLWPEVTSRLFDDETHVVAGSLQIVAVMCEYAGGFMRTRIDSLWPEILSLHRKLCRDMRSGTGKSSQGNEVAGRVGKEVGYVDTSTRGLKHSFELLLKTVVQFVHVDAEKFDDVVDMLGPPLSGLEEEVRGVLEGCNADVVWLAEYREGSRRLEPLEGSGFKFAQPG